MVDGGKRKGSRKTYWHLQALGRKPDEYDIASSRLLYHSASGSAVHVPMQPWYVQHLRGNALRCADWERFDDPQRLTYRKYTELQTRGEAHIDGLMQAMGSPAYEAALPSGWRAQLQQWLPVLRFPIHGLQLVAAYLAHLAPSSKLVILGLFQSADELRRLQRIAQRCGDLEQHSPGSVAPSRERWEREPRLQPLRELIERLLVTYDWSQALIALNVVCKPAFDELILGQLSAAAQGSGDALLCRMLQALDEDCRRQRAATAALLRFLIDEDPENLATIRSGFEAWRALTIAAVAGFSELLHASPPGPPPRAETLDTFWMACWGTLGLVVEGARDAEPGHQQRA